MKKRFIYSFILLAGLSLAACGGKGKTTESSTTAKSTEKTSQTTTATSKTTTKSSTSQSSTKSSSSETKTSESQSTVKSEKNTPAKQADTVLNQLKNDFSNDQLPQAILTSQTAVYLTAATTGAVDQGNFRILYYAEDHGIEVNDPAVNDLQPIASFEKKTYDSNEAAASAVNQIIDNGGSQINLGYGITGYQQGAAGSSFLSWQEGNWSLVVRASNIGGEVAEPLAKEAVAYLETAMLPAPQNVGQISLTASISDSYQNNSVVWQKGTTVYTIQHFDALQALKMAVSTNQ
ncbi:hypothetical protein UAW_00212 [Enterococcus haemoperoxidus ATCC BAA-382]|uniref:Lipoprotein n=1 Tax=Enterococcus haemoperoxidus ATCC BAA-382 TaxID=1158608 RepID=R2TJ79_9ENTE|nr:hypothetical protein [Enterococcus haemoperoxidus]EOI00197.1 hypothetical protein UAW_00212 [Enterococcus haemoperoxidus ATCC BAA-382]EOT59565.1 hypothetical protein I583_02199 [Enterococcus haemoperoxidus ATCC BAA-382]OJG52403.1 hypothetical protein RV06_GL000974 [Enterococcus haemoperoxidus]